MTAANARLKVATVCMNAVLDKEANLQTFFRYMEEAGLREHNSSFSLRSLFSRIPPGAFYR